jgi:branched-chain amino acid transport system substrate-binding protein
MVNNQKQKLGTTKLLAIVALSAAALAVAVPVAQAQAQAKEQFFPVLVYRTGAYAPNGVPFANGYVDYLKMINARDGGINGVKITFEECETGYATDRGVECYERLKAKGPTGATAFHPLSTGITFALTEKAPGDKVPIVTMGYGRSESQEGRVFPWNFPLGGTYWVGADVLVQHIAKKEGGFDKLKGKKVALVYHDSPFGKEPIALLQERSKMHGFDLQLVPVTAPGVEQKSAWLLVRQNKPDYVFLWGWGVMNSTAIKEAVATGFPREKMFGVWWSAAEPDVTPVGDGAKGYSGLNFLAGQGQGKVHADILKVLHGKGAGTGPKEEVGSVLYNRGMIGAAVTVEAVHRAQEKYGKRPLTGTEVRWGLENLNIDTKRIAALGFDGFMTPISSSCADHMGATQARVQTWDGTKWTYSSDVYTADMQVIKPLVNSFSKKYAGEKKITERDCSKEAL